MSKNWFRDLKEQTNTFIENLKNEDEVESTVKTETPERDNTVENYRSKLQSPQKSLSETLPMKKESSGLTVNKSTNVKVMEPKNEDGAYVVVDEIRAGNIVLMKLDKAESDAPVILNIVYGACHYANIMPEKVGPLMLLIDPKFKTR